MNKTSIALSFIFGTGVGALIGWKLAKDYYKKIADDEIESVVNSFSRKAQKLEETVEKDESVTERNMTVVESTSVVLNPNPTSYSAISKKVFDSNDGYSERPLIIDEDEFGSDEMYDQQTVSYYRDGTLADQFDNLIDFDDVVGNENKDYLEDSYSRDEKIIYIRNDEYQTYYEVILEDGTYDEMVGGPGNSSQEDE